MRHLLLGVLLVGITGIMARAAFPITPVAGSGTLSNSSFQIKLSVGNIVGKSTSNGANVHLGFMPASHASFAYYLTIGYPLPVHPLDGTLSVMQFVVKPAKDMKLEWTEETNQLPVNYRVFFGTNPTSLPLVATTAILSYSVENLTFAIPYYWRVEAFDNFGRSTMSDRFSFSISPDGQNFYSAPNPFRAGMEPTYILFSMPGSGTAKLEIFALPYYDLVFERSLDNLQDGSNVFAYDGRDLSGNVLYSGAYSARISMSGERGNVVQKHKILVVR